MCAHLQNYYRADEQYIKEYRETFRRALDGEAVAMLREAREVYVSCL